MGPDRAGRWCSARLAGAGGEEYGWPVGQFREGDQVIRLREIRRVRPDDHGRRAGTPDRVPQGRKRYPGAELPYGYAALGECGGERFEGQAVLLLVRAGEEDP